MSFTLLLQLILQFLSLTVWLLIIPFLVGLLPARFLPVKYRTPGTVFIFGFIIYLAIFELIGIIVVLNAFHGGMTILQRFFTPVIISLAALGLGLEIVKRSVKFPQIPLKYIKSFSLERKILWSLFFLILGFQFLMAFTHVSIDGDDAFFIVQSVIAKDRGFLYRVEPYTGYGTPLDVRNALAIFPIWITSIAEKARMHPKMLAHSFLPLFLLSLTYLLYFQIGKNLIRRKIEFLPIFMIFIALIQMFGNVSIFTNETFLMTRTWQGKSLAANFIIPAVFWYFLLIGEKDVSKKRPPVIYWYLLAILLWTAGIASSLAVFLVLILTVVLSLALTIYHRNIRLLINSALACLPAIVHILIYVFY